MCGPGPSTRGSTVDTFVANVDVVDVDLVWAQLRATITYKRVFVRLSEPREYRAGFGRAQPLCRNDH